jgi:hypothetical protein
LIWPLCLIQATVEVMEHRIGDVRFEWHDRRHLRLSEYAAGHRGHHHESGRGVRRELTPCYWGRPRLLAAPRMAPRHASFLSFSHAGRLCRERPHRAIIHRLGWPQRLSLIGLTVRIVVLDPNIAMEDVPGR